MDGRVGTCASQQGSLLALLDGFEPKPINLYAIYPPTRFLAAKARLFIDFLAERFAGSRPQLKDLRACRALSRAMP